MTRRWLTLASGLVLSTTLVTSALAQNSTERAPGRSLFGNWFGWRENSSASQQSGKSNQNGDRYAQNSDDSNDGPQASQSRMNQMPPDPAASRADWLPGLGGSPLPSSGSKTTTNNAAANGSRPSPGTQSNAANGARKPNSPGTMNRQNTVRQLDISPPNPTPAPNPATNSTTRQSPVRHVTPHIAPDDLRRELSGTSESSARTARANQHNNTPENSASAENGAATNQPMLPAIGPPNAAAKNAAIFDQSKQNIRPDDAGPQSAVEAFGAKEVHSTPNNFARTPHASPISAGQQSSRGKEAFGEALQVASGGDPSVLASNQTPILSADIRGPKQILVGREALYRVRLQNQSDIAAEGIVATVRIPSGTDVTNATSTQGMVQQMQDAQSKGQLQWQIARLERHAGETLELRLVPRESRPLELGITWTVAPIGSRAVVEVQEPKLQLEIAGPNEVLYDKPQVFKLTISNPGTGPAENVKIDLMPLSAGKETNGKDTVKSHPLGDLAPGASQTVEVELTARDAGKLAIKAAASAEGGLVCDASKEVFCRKPELEVDWRGPATKYSGTLATYFFRVRNPGTAPAEDVTLRVSLPEGAEFTSASEGQMFDTKLREVAWHVGTLRPGDDNYMELKCVLKNAGPNQLKITAATAAGNLSDSKTASTKVVALADLKLDIIDPSGPVAVGSPAVYEIHVKNRGASAAKDVNVAGLFSEGIEPEQAEGAMYTVADGRVSFRTIEELPAGRDVSLRIRAHAVQPGTHVFRAEVLCRDLEIKLAAEETTRFYADDTPDAGKSEKQATSRSEAFQSTVR